MIGVHLLVFALLVLLPVFALLLVLLPNAPKIGWVFWLAGAAGATFWWWAWARNYPSSQEEQIIAESSDLITMGFAMIASWPLALSLLVWLRRKRAAQSSAVTAFGNASVLIGGALPAGLILLILGMGL